MPFDGQNLTDVQRVLLKAAGIVRQGWCQYSLEDGQGRYCALGAISMAADGQTKNLSESALATAAYFRRTLNTTVADWNNAPERTAEQVAQALEAAAMKGGE